MLSRIGSWIGERRGLSTRVEKFAPIKEETGAEAAKESADTKSAKRGRTRTREEARPTRLSAKDSRADVSVARATPDVHTKRPPSRRTRRSRPPSRSGRRKPDEQTSGTEQRTEQHSVAAREQQQHKQQQVHVVIPSTSSRQVACKEPARDTCTCSCHGDVELKSRGDSSGNLRHGDSASPPAGRVTNCAHCQTEPNEQRSVVDRVKAVKKMTPRVQPMTDKAGYYRSGVVYPENPTMWAEKVFTPPPEPPPEQAVKKSADAPSPFPKKHGLVCRVSSKLGFRRRRTGGQDSAEENLAFLEYYKTGPDEESSVILDSDGFEAPDPSRNVAHPHYSPFSVQYDGPVDRIATHLRFLGLKKVDGGWMRESKEEHPLRRGTGRVHAWMRERRPQGTRRVDRVERRAQASMEVDAIELHDLEGSSDGSSSTVLMLHNF